MPHLTSGAPAAARPRRARRAAGPAAAQAARALLPPRPLGVTRARPAHPRRRWRRWRRQKGCSASQFRARVAATSTAAAATTTAGRRGRITACRGGLGRQHVGTAGTPAGAACCPSPCSRCSRSQRGTAGTWAGGARGYGALRQGVASEPLATRAHGAAAAARAAAAVVAAVGCVEPVGLGVCGQCWHRKRQRAATACPTGPRAGIDPAARRAQGQAPQLTRAVLSRVRFRWYS